jgi:hypothetical protein
MADMKIAYRLDAGADDFWSDAHDQPIDEASA